MRIRRRKHDERGAIAILAAALSLVLLLMAALAVDISAQVFRKHQIQNQLDQAAVAAGFYMDPQRAGCDTANPTKLCIKAAVDNAKTYFAANYDQTLQDSQIDFWCIIAKDPSSATAKPTRYQIPIKNGGGSGVCNPDAKTSDTSGDFLLSAYTSPASGYPSSPPLRAGLSGMVCNAELCAIPCAVKATSSNGWDPGNSVYNGFPVTCNTVRVKSDRTVPFNFAAAGGHVQGSTGARDSVACKGPCGSIAPNPMNIVVVSDRTGSMAIPDRGAMISGIEQMLQRMSPDVQYVSLGTIGRSAPTSTRAAADRTDQACSALTAPSTSESSGYWIPLHLTKNYLTAGAGSALNKNSNVIRGLSCMLRNSPTLTEPSCSTGVPAYIDPSGAVTGYVAGGVANPSCAAAASSTTGTELASPLKAAGQYLFNLQGSSNNASSLESSGSRPGVVRNVIIFETDGQPNEGATSSTYQGKNAVTQGTTGVNTAGDVYADSSIYTETGPTLGTPGPLGASTSWTCTGTINPWSGSTNCPASYKYGSTTKTIVYRIANLDTPKVTTQTYHGGEDACNNLAAVASSIKAHDPNALIITIGFNLGSVPCALSNGGGVYNGSAYNPTSTSGTAVNNGAPWLSMISNSTNLTTPLTACIVAGTLGTQTQPYVLKNDATCGQNVVLTYTQARTVPRTDVVTKDSSKLVTTSLAAASGGSGIPASVDQTPSHCGNNSAADRLTENTDGDFFFCAASGDQLGSLFITALSQANKGVKLVNMP